MAGEEPGKMPELYVEALLKEHGLSERPQAAMRSKSKCVRNLLPTSPLHGFRQNAKTMKTSS